MEDLSAFSARPRLAALLDHFAEIADTRQGWKVMYPLREVLFLVVCGTIASGDDYDDIVDWGKAHLAFLRGFAEFHFGIPCADWLRCVMNRIDPKLFMECFSSWVAACWPDKLDLVAIDGKTSRRTIGGPATRRCIWCRPSGQHAATHDEKQSMNSLGSMRFMTQRSQSAHGMPKWNSAKPRRKARCALPQSTMSS